MKPEVIEILLALSAMGVLLGMVGIFFLRRNDLVFKVRMRFIDVSMSNYRALPRYGEMLYSPKFLHLWTFEQWQAWLAKQGASS